MILNVERSTPLLLLLASCSKAPDHRSADGAVPKCAGIAKSRMVWIEGGSFAMGEAAQYREEGPARAVDVQGFWISETEITNAQFAEFVAATRYRTEAERQPPQISGAPPEMLKPGSAVFRIPTADNPNRWNWMPGADWRHPNGPQSSIVGRDNDPVVQVSYVCTSLCQMGRGAPSNRGRVGIRGTRWHGRVT